MTKYRIEVREVLCRIVEAEADSEKEAVEQVKEKYRCSNIVLDASDYIETEIGVKR
ncbi:MAG: DpnD/PcfM family protein [Prevotella sp.]|nr:DpnD/PcfM family protein [Prevotella sp.]